MVINHLQGLIRAWPETNTQILPEARKSKYKTPEALRGAGSEQKKSFKQSVLRAETTRRFLTEGSVAASLTVFFLRRNFNLCRRELFNQTTGVEPKRMDSGRGWRRRRAGWFLSDGEPRAAEDLPLPTTNAS